LHQQNERPYLIEPIHPNAPIPAVFIARATGGRRRFELAAFVA
jgi:hypothetical protein